jgi:predicted anti-sigma-YlaC factor YlaD
MQTKNNTDDCGVLRENLFAYRENALPASLTEQLDKHVAHCNTCSMLVKQFDDVLVSVEDQAKTEPRPYAETRLQQRIENYLENSRKPLFSFSPSALLQPAIISLGLMLALAIGILIGSEKAGRNISLSNISDQEIRSDLNIPEFTSDNLIDFTE